MVGEIGLIGLGLAALGADFRNDGGRLAFGEIPVIDRDRGAFGREGECDVRPTSRVPPVTSATRSFNCMSMAVPYWLPSRVDTLAAAASYSKGLTYESPDLCAALPRARRFRDAP